MFRTLIKQSSQQSQESFPNQLTTSKAIEERKISDTPSYSSSILKNRSTASGSSNRLSLIEVQLGSTGKILSSVAGKIVETSSKKVTEKKTSIFKSGKDEASSKLDGRPSISSLKKSETKFKTSIFKKADPKLRIRPFKSKVTFSDEPQPTIKSGKTDDSYSDKFHQQNFTTNYTIPDHKSTLTIHLDKYDLSASSPELNKASSTGKFPYSKHKINIDKTESNDRLMNIRMATGSSASVVTASELFNKLPIETLIQLGLPSNQSSQSSELKLGAYTSSDQRQRSSSFSKLSSSQTLNAAAAAAARKTQSIATAGHKLKNEIPETYLDKPKVSEANRRKSFQLQSSQTPIEMHSEYDINFQDNYKTDSNDYWLRHRSLPNIQELVEDSGSENPSSPTVKDVNNEIVTGVSEYLSKKPAKLKIDIRTSPTKIPKDSKEQLREKLTKKHQPKEIQIEEDDSNKQLTSEEQNLIKHNAQEKRTLYSKASKSSSSSNQSSSSLQRKCRKKIPIHLSSTKSNSFKQSSTDSDSSYYTAHSVHITIPEMETLGSFKQASEDSIGSNNLSYVSTIPESSSITMPQREMLRNFHTSNESTNSSANLSYHSASELSKNSFNNLNDSTQSLSTETGTIPTVVVIPTSPISSEQNVFFGQTDEELQQDRRRRLLEHFHLTREQNDRLDDKKD